MIGSDVAATTLPDMQGARGPGPKPAKLDRRGMLKLVVKARLADRKEM